MRQAVIVVACLVLAIAAGPVADASNFIIVNGDAVGEGLNDPTPVAPVGGNTGVTLGEQRLILLQSTASVWAGLIDSPVDIVILARFNPISSGGNSCGVLGQTGPGDPFMNFPGAPVPNILYHSALADSISGVEQNPGEEDFYIIYNSNLDTAVCPNDGFYYGLDGNAGTGEIELFPVVLHEMAHGLGFASFVNPSTGGLFFGLPGIFDYFIYDMTAGLHWNEMNNSQRQASAVNTGNLVWDGASAIAAAADTLYAGAMELEVTSPPAIAGTYAALGAVFGGAPPDQLDGEFELVDTGSATPNDACDPLVGFTPGRIAVLDRGNCEFGLKALNAENAGAKAAVIANDRDGTTLVNMAGGVDGESVTIPVVALGENDGVTIKAQLPGVTGSLHVIERLGSHASGRPLLYAPPAVQPGSSVSHWDTSATPELLMEPFLGPELLDDVDMTPDLFIDLGHTIFGAEDIFADGFELGDTSAWSGVSP